MWTLPIGPGSWWRCCVHFEDWASGREDGRPKGEKRPGRAADPRARGAAGTS